MCLGNVWVHTVDVLTLIRTEKAVFPYRLIKTRIRYRTFFRTKRGLLETAKRNQHYSPLFEEHEKDCENEAGKGDDMIPLESLTLEEDCDYHTEDGETDNLLNYFELH